MSTRKAFINAAVYLGGGEVIDRGFVISNGGRIEQVGAASEFTRTSDVEVIDLPGRLLLPGLVDSHIHLVAYALSLTRVDLSQTTSLEDGLRMIQKHLANVPNGAWLLGRGWDKQRWHLAGFPDRKMLDRAVPDNPAALASRDGHLLWVNSIALGSLGLEESGFDIDGGEIERDRKGKPTGILKEKAVNLVLKQVCLEEPEATSYAIELACKRLIRLGVTTVHTIENEHYAKLLSYAVQHGRVGLRLVRLREISDASELDGLEPSPEAVFIKVIADGTLGSQTASMLEPYCGQPENLGICVVSRQELHDMVFRSARMGFSVAVHAIGDRANMETLDVYERARRKFPSGDIVFRVEHAQVLRAEDIPRFGRQGVIASMQPIHAVSDMEVAQRYWGSRCRNAYAWKGIVEAGGTVAFGSDAPIEDPDPLRGLHAAVTRSDPAKPDASPWGAEQCLEISQAIDCYTAGAALAAGMERIAGRIGEGLRSDFTILDHDILADPSPDAILETSVEATVIGGEVHQDL